MTAWTMRTDGIPLALVLAAAGSSERMGGGIKKEYLSMAGGTVLSEAARVFLESQDFSLVIITIPDGHKERAKEALLKDPSIAPLLKDTRLVFVSGGETRQQSVFNALKKARSILKDPDAVVLVHDAARPFVSRKIVKRVTSSAVRYGAAVPAVTPVDTQKQIAGNRTIQAHLKRSELRAVQTPQGFALEPLLACHKKALRQGRADFTDDSELWDAYPDCTGGRKVRVVEGDPANKKITFKEDMPAAVSAVKKNVTAGIRVGLGTDLHRLVPGRRLMLGGITIPCDKGEDGHSDGDVLLHAASDALLGASGLGDIGSYFPPSDKKWKDADSADLIRTIWRDVKSAGWSLLNMDCVVETETPKILPWREKIISSMAGILGVNESQIFVKAKTNEGVDAVGKGNAIKAFCVCLLTQEAPE